jgi:hypothetical protein
LPVGVRLRLAAQDFFGRYAIFDRFGSGRVVTYGPRGRLRDRFWPREPR